MKFLVFSDIHGSVPVVERMTSLVRAHEPDRILLLGDILYHGPRNPLPEGYDPGQACRLLEALAPRITAVQGNCDSDVDITVLPFALATSSWVLTETTRIFMAHGHISSPQYLPKLAHGDVLLQGHTHIPLATTTAEGIHLCNPGSPALPKEGYPPCYGLFEDGIFSVLTEANERYMTLDCR